MITGFPSPAQGYEQNTIDLNTALIRHPSATVFMKIDSSHYQKGLQHQKEAKAGWEMKREFLSPNVTTDLEKVPVII